MHETLHRHGTTSFSELLGVVRHDTRGDAGAGFPPMNGSGRVCQDCGELSPDDAQFCGSCGVALSTEHLHHPGLAALVDDTGGAPRPPDTDAADASQATSAHPAAEAAAAGTPASSPATSAAAATPAPPPPTSVAPSAPPAGPPTAIAPAAPPPGGAAASPRHERPWLLPTLVVVSILAAAAAVLVFLGTRSDGSDQPAVATDPAATPSTAAAATTAPAATAATTAVPTSSEATTTAPATTATPTTTAPVDAAARLAELAAADLPRALELRERWVPQLSAKTDGTEWEGTVYDLPAILDLHERLSAEVGGALLVEGSSLAFLSDGERMAGWWFTIADIDFDDPDAALAWCADAGFDRSNCAARLLTDRDDATGTLRLRPA